MTVEQALSILSPTERTIASVKKARTEKIRQYHPDVNPNGLEMAKMINAAFDMLMKNLFWTQEDFAPKGDPAYHLDEEIDRAWKAIQHLPGVKITLAGVWLWVVGDTKPVKEELKAAGFTWARKKQAWSWKPAGTKRRYSKKAWNFDEIYATYGRVDLESRMNPAIS